ncbi:Crp/Fnr family transcriptional regulator [Mangrovibacterium diazotrophicum]|uniref:CRP/FNR family transcriptional regulator n=1 Tax=Mangrovibacterium diazotrophicum TaxID=1261403 RepID=A0A419W8S3_9BACT|nr:Crp/Fnr family transcriptional regulator [Mangrovibacterium diazotrophicum]RKD91871.1 CRP/FNR family transcriptional regulator [Mangrovibacterium diazotrophicum]
MDLTNYSCRNCRIKSRAVSVLEHDQLAILEQGCSQTDFSKGELILKENAPAQFVTYIRQGFVKLYKKGISAKEYILSISGEGAFLGLQNLDEKRKTNYFSAVAITDTKVCYLDIHYFDQLLKMNGAFASEVISYIFHDEMNYFERLINNVQQQLPGRLATALLYFYRQVYKKNPFELNLTKAELASLIGTSRESVTRQLKSFHDDGIIELQKSQIVIRDENKLEEIKQKG